MNPDVNAIVQHLVAELSATHQRLALAAGVIAKHEADNAALRQALDEARKASEEKTTTEAG